MPEPLVSKVMRRTSWKWVLGVRRVLLTSLAGKGCSWLGWSLRSAKTMAKQLTVALLFLATYYHSCNKV